MTQNLLTKRGSLRRFFSMLWKARLPYLGILAYILFSMLITNIVLDTTEYASEMYAGNTDFRTIILPFLVYTVLSMLLGAVSGVFSSILQALIDRNMRLMLWKKLVRLPMDFYGENKAGELISRVTTDISSVSSLIMTVFVLMITNGYSVIATFSRIQNYDARLMLTMLGTIPINVGISFIMGRIRFSSNDAVNRCNAEFTQTVTEAVRNTQLIKSSGLENHEFNRGMARAEALYKATMTRTWTQYISSPIGAMSSCIQFIIVVLVGRGFYADGTITLAQWIAFYAFSNSIVSIIRSYCENWTILKASQGATDRISSIMDMKEENRDDGETVTSLHGDIIFEDLTFSYGEQPLFENLNLTLKEGKITAIIGLSGSGKTTLLNLIERFYAPQSGHIRFGQQHIEGLKLKEYRSLLGYITQESTILQGSIRDNLLSGIKRRVDDEELYSVCEKAGLTEFLASRPAGLDDAVGENGSALSGGQRQRLSVARTLLKRPDYLLLDEVTSAIDIEGKEEIMNALLDNMQGKTVVLVSHDLQAIRRADELVVLEDGKVTASGPARELLENSAYVQSILGKEAEHETD